jgi:putative ABC transport system permease protein
MFNDIHYALRVLAKNRSFTAVVVFALALGIGANTAIFSMADAIMFHPYSFRDLGHIVALSETIPAVGPERYGVSAGNYFDWKEQNHVFDQMAATEPWGVTLTTADGSRRVRASLVSPEFFPMLGAQPIEGRLLSPENRERNEVLVSYGFWQQRLGRDPRPVGKLLELNGLSYTIAGVMGKEFDFPMFTEIWSPWIVTPETSRERIKHDLQVIAHLKSGVSLTQAHAEMRTIGMRLSREYPLSNTGRGVDVMLLRDTVDEYAVRFMSVVTAAVLFLLLLACANVANLQLARGASRQAEMALRMALGASRWRIVRQLLIEGTILSSLGAILGLPLALWGLTVIKANVPALIARHLPGLGYAQLDGRMLTITLVAALLTGIAFTIPAAAQACSERLHGTLKEGGRGSLASGRRTMRSALVVSEIILAVALLIGAGLMVKGFHNLAAVNPGFNPSNVLIFGVTLPESKYPENYQVSNFYSEMLRRLQAVSGMHSPAIISDLPALDVTRSSSILIEGETAPSPDRPLLAEARVASEDYLQTFGVPIVKGRSLSNQDSANSQPVAVISQTAARRFWPGQNPLGRRVKLTSRELTTPWLTVVGVAGDVKHFILSSEVRPTIYLSYLQQPVRSFYAVFRTTAKLDRTAMDVRAAVRSMDGTLPVPDIEEINRSFADLAAGVGVVAGLLGAFAGVALVLAAAGIYAVMSYSVAQRTREIGIRMALGARPQDVLRLIVGNALRLVAIGLSIGCLVAYALSRGMSSALPGVVDLDPFTFAGFAILITAIALAASLIPSRRATKVDPLLALRSE